MKILITGGASGLGEEITRVCSENIGNKVYFTYYRAVENAIRLQEEYINTEGISCNLLIPSDLEHLKKQIKNFDIDVLINNAYMSSCIKTYFHKTDLRDFIDEFEKNVIPTIAITQEAINFFREKKKGKIITILTSFLNKSPPIGSGLYVANKAYLAELSKLWATENAKYNISANTVSPSFMLTPANDTVDYRIVEQIRDRNPLKKLLTTRETAEVVAFLCSASQQINGIDIPIAS